MAIDRFKEGMAQYLAGEAKRHKEQTAQSFDDAARFLRSDSVSISEIKALTDSANSGLATTSSVIGGLIQEVNDFATKITAKFSKAGIGLPPVEILQALSIETGQFQTQSASIEQEDEAKKKAKEAIRSRLGNASAFIVPLAPGETDPLAQKINLLHLPSKPHNGLLRSGISNVGKLLETNSDDLLYVRNFYRRSLEHTIEALYCFGVRVKESPIDSQSSVPDQQLEADQKIPE